MKKWLHAPALHMLAIGTLLFGFVELRGGSFFPKKPRLEIPASRLEQMLDDFKDDTGRRPTREEWHDMVEMQIDDEVLFQYALALGMHENTAAKARLAQIAQFVEANPHEADPEAGVKAAMELGLHESDLVVRRILVDSARRLIRAVVLLQKPTDKALADFYQANAAAYIRPARVRVSQLAINAFKWPDSEKRARLVLEKIRRENLSFEAALALADETPANVHLTSQTEANLATQMGSEFAAAAMQLEQGEWSAPVSTQYGYHLIYLHERQEEYLPPLAALRTTVEQGLLDKLADEWMRLRLKELRLEFEVVLPGSTT